MAEEPTQFRAPRTLSAQDAEVVDRLLASLSASGAESGSGEWTSDGSPRSERVCRLMGLIDAWPAQEPPADLTQRTLARIGQVEQQARFDRQIHALKLGGRPTAAPRRFGWNDLAAIAAMLIAAFSLGLPMLSTSRGQSRQIACANNLRTAGAAMAGYAADNQGQMPRLGNFEGEPWFLVGQGVEAENGQPRQVRSNSAHLFLLVRRGYIHPGALACPENEHAAHHMPTTAFDWPNAKAVSYSYQNQFTRRPVRLENAPMMAVLADKNPLFIIGPDGETKQVRLKFRHDLSPAAASEMHRRGQNTLRADGAVFWTVRPVLPGGQDNMWLLDGVREYHGDESPTHEGDAHLIP